MRGFRSSSVRSGDPIEKDLSLGVESLERRQLLAGDVSAFVTAGGDLVINGDNANNAIDVSFFEGDFVITGEGTMVNGQNEQVTLSSVTDDVRINMRSGDNRVTLNNFVSVPEFIVPGSLSVMAGSGNDAILLEHLDGSIVVGEDLRINTRGGDDEVVVGDYVLFESRAEIADNGFVDVGDDVMIRTGGGQDVVHLRDVENADRTSVAMGGGDDGLAIYNTESSRTRATGGGGFDQLCVISLDELQTRSFELEEDCFDGPQ